jgi:hypothetical protein
MVPLAYQKHGGRGNHPPGTSHSGVIPSGARNLALILCSEARPEAERDSSFLSVEGHVIPAKAGIRLVGTWTPACAGVTKRMTFISMGGPQAHAHSE